MSQQYVGQPGQLLTEADLDEIRATTFVRRIEFQEQLASTNDHAVQLAAEAEESFPLLVVTNQQTAGRGRGENAWWADTGSLAFSLLWRPVPSVLPPRAWPQVSLHVALGIGAAIEELLEDQTAQLKWPNDIYLHERKVCGILVEVPAAAPNTLVVGVGLNVNNRLHAAPHDLSQTAIALCQVAKRPFRLGHVLARVLVRISEHLSYMSRGDGLQPHWNERCLLTGRQVGLNLGARQIAGRCRGIADDGALLVETGSGVERCYGGVVEFF